MEPNLRDSLKPKWKNILVSQHGQLVKSKPKSANVRLYLSRRESAKIILHPIHGVYVHLQKEWLKILLPKDSSHSRRGLGRITNFRTSFRINIAIDFSFDHFKNTQKWLEFENRMEYRNRDSTSCWLRILHSEGGNLPLWEFFHSAVG